MPIRETHELLNLVYDKANQIEEHLKKLALPFTRGSYHNHYISFDDAYHLQKYPLPVFTIEGAGDIGVNIDGVFFEFTVKRLDLTPEVIAEIIRRYPDIEIYGYQDCLHDFYSKGTQTGKAIAEIGRVTEDKIQFGLCYPLKTDLTKVVSCFLDLKNLLPSHARIS